MGAAFGASNGCYCMKAVGIDGTCETQISAAQRSPELCKVHLEPCRSCASPFGESQSAQAGRKHKLLEGPHGSRHTATRVCGTNQIVLSPRRVARRRTARVYDSICRLEMAVIWPTAIAVDLPLFGQLRFDECARGTATSVVVVG